MKRWYWLAIFALVAGCAGGSQSPTGAVANAVPNVQMGAIGPRLNLRIAHLGRPHYFFDRKHFRALAKHHAHSYYYGVGNLSYGGGPVDATPKVYLIFWGISSASDTTHDPDGVATYAANFFAALPTSSWLNTVTQYYQTYGGPQQFITSPATILTGTYYDSSLPPSPYTDTDAANEALKAANAYGYDANTNYIVITPTGYKINGFDGYNYTTGGFCAYHSATTVTGGHLLSYTVFPYLPDVGSDCGANSVAGPLDGVSIVGGHEEAETITDANASNGWLDSSSPSMEIGDKCAWIHLQNTAFPNGQSYPTQPLWSNASSSCVQSYGTSPTPTPAPGTTPTPAPGTNVVVNPGFETGKLKPWSSCRSKNTLPAAFVVKGKAHGGKFDAYVGTVSGGKEPAGITTVCQLVNIPAGAQLTFYARGISDDNRNGVYQFARLYNTTGTLAATLLRFKRDDTKWLQQTADLSAYANGQYLLAFGVQGKANAHGHYIGLYIDDVTVAP